MLSRASESVDACDWQLSRGGNGPVESMNDIDIGLGPTAHLQFSPHHHMGLGRVHPTVVRCGKPEVFSDWAVVLAQR